MWPDRRFIELTGVALPIVQAPMAGANGAAMAAAVSIAGGLGSLPCAMLDPARVREALAEIRRHTEKPINLNFFCHRPPQPSSDRDARWRARLAPYFRELGISPDATAPAQSRSPFDATMCDTVEALRPRVVSFHFGLPAPELVQRVKAAGCLVFSSATSAAEARWLEARGCDAIIAQGVEAGGHRGMFLETDIASQSATMALVPQVVDAVSVPVIAAGAIADGRGIAAALALGASAVQIGSAYLLTTESTISPLHRRALADAADNRTALTNLFSGRPARGLINRLMREIGPISADAPPFPTAGAALAPLKAAAEAMGSSDFSSLWAGEAAALARAMPAQSLTRLLADEALSELAGLALK